MGFFWWITGKTSQPKQPVSTSTTDTPSLGGLGLGIRGIDMGALDPDWMGGIDPIAWDGNHVPVSLGKVRTAASAKRMQRLNQFIGFAMGFHVGFATKGLGAGSAASAVAGLAGAAVAGKFNAGRDYALGAIAGGVLGSGIEPQTPAPTEEVLSTSPGMGQGLYNPGPGSRYELGDYAPPYQLGDYATGPGDNWTFSATRYATNKYLSIIGWFSELVGGPEIPAMPSYSGAWAETQLP